MNGKIVDDFHKANRYIWQNREGTAQVHLVSGLKSTMKSPSPLMTASRRPSTMTAVFRKRAAYSDHEAKRDSKNNP